jgi:GntR family transcriptional regulator / MocR family aminotransferase
VLVDERGIRVDLLERLRARAVLITPAYQFPTGSVLVHERQQKLIDWAIRRSAFIIEADYDAEYRFDCEPVGAAGAGSCRGHLRRLPE